MAFRFKRSAFQRRRPARIPPGQTLTAPDRWPLCISARAEDRHRHVGPATFSAQSTHELRLDYGELRALPSKEVVADIHCVTS